MQTFKIICGMVIEKNELLEIYGHYKIKICFDPEMRP